MLQIILLHHNQGVGHRFPWLDSFSPAVLTLTAYCSLSLPVLGKACGNLPLRVFFSSFVYVFVPSGKYWGVLPDIIGKHMHPKLKAKLRSNEDPLTSHPTPACDGTPLCYLAFKTGTAHKAKR